MKTIFVFPERASNLGFASGTPAFSERSSDLYFQWHLAFYKSLMIGIAYYKIHIRDAFFIHVIDSIVAAASYSQNFYY
jgi:hypothetical protein